jgi:teichuronic acid biosynthesis glycosyltransferase TuaC
MIANPLTSANADTHSGRALHVLTLTPFYPHSDDDVVGCFVAEPLPWVEPLGVTNTVLAARPFYRGRIRPSSTATAARWSHFFSLPGGLGLPSAGAFLFAGILPSVRRLHHLNPVNVIHAHGPLPCGHAAALLARELNIPFIVTVHGLDAFSTNQVRGLAGKWCQRVSRMTYHAACQVVCVSDKVRDQVLRGAAAVNATVVYNGVDPQMFAPAIGDDGGSTVILSVGTLIPIKGHELLLRAFAALHQRFPEISCEIVGEGPEQSRLSALAVSLKLGEKVRFLGRNSHQQVAEAMRRCALFALPSRYEGLGCVYLEAMSAGKAVIGCRGQGIEEVIEHGVNGWLVEPDDLDALTGALSVLLPDLELRRRIGAAARQTILRGFTLAYQAERLAAIYSECRA